jgi:FkbM family methyltransferase
MTSVPTHLISRRRLKALAARLLPEALKRRVRGLLYGYRQSRVSLPAVFHSDASGPAVVIDNRIRLRFAEQDRRGIRTHFADHGAAIEEMSSFIDIAADARTFFDIGADRGIFSLVFCALGDDRRAVAYEPSPGRFAAAAELAVLNGVDGRLTLRQAALGTTHGRAGGTLFADGTMVPGPHDPTGTPADVEMTTVDREVEALGLVPDVMKIDVEGYEYEVLRGAQALLRARKPVLCLELHLDLLERRGISPAELLANLQSLGYHFRSCVGSPLAPSDVSDSLHAILRFVAL